MASIRLGGGVVDMRGSIGGTTFGRGQGGQISRARVKPIRRHSSFNSASRAALAAAAAGWRTAVAGGNLTAWTTYAAGLTNSNKVGDSITVTPPQAFTMVNAIRILAGLAISLTPPTTPGRASPVAFDLGLTAAGGILTITQDPTGWNQLVTTEYLVIFVSTIRQASKVAASKAFQLALLVPGVPSTGPTFPLTIKTFGATAAGSRVTVKIVHIDTASRTSIPSFAEAVAA